MGQATSIEWTDATWNPVRGCSRISEGCRNCYAERVAARYSDPGPFATFAERKYTYKTDGSKVNWEPRWTGKVELIEKHLADPLKWRKAKRIFVNSMSDLFHENLPDEAIDRVFAVMALCPQHTFQILTKRADRMRQYVDRLAKSIVHLEGQARSMGCTFKFHGLDGREHSILPWPIPNVWLGVSVENQQAADERIPRLLQTPAAIRFVSYEPALGLVDFENIRQQLQGESLVTFSALHETDALNKGRARSALDWIIVGGESGPGSRPFDIRWARDTIAQCKAAGVACFVKQLGADPYISMGQPEGAKLEKCRCDGPGFKDRKGGDWAEWPSDLRVREFPEVRA